MQSQNNDETLSSKKQNDHNISNGAIKLESNFIFDSPAYKQPGGKYIVQNYNKYLKNSGSKSK